MPSRCHRKWEVGRGQVYQPVNNPRQTSRQNDCKVCLYLLIVSLSSLRWLERASPDRLRMSGNQRTASLCDRPEPHDRVFSFSLLGLQAPVLPAKAGIRGVLLKPTSPQQGPVDSCFRENEGENEKAMTSRPKEIALRPTSPHSCPRPSFLRKQESRTPVGGQGGRKDPQRPNGNGLWIPAFVGMAGPLWPVMET